QNCRLAYVTGISEATGRNGKRVHYIGVRIRCACPEYRTVVTVEVYAAFAGVTGVRYDVCRQSSLGVFNDERGARRDNARKGLGPGRRGVCLPAFATCVAPVRELVVSGG